MYLRSITLKNFRTYLTESVSFHRRFNLIIGDNAQGKTNLLEAIYMLCNFRPFKQVSNEELIAFGQPQARLKGEIEAENGLNEIHIALSPEGKNVRVNGKVVYRLSKYTGMFVVVLYLPTDLNIVKGSPSVRRQYIDTLISNLDLEHIKDTRAYYKTLGQRNALLSRGSKLDINTMDVWDEKLAETGARVTSRRLKALKKLGETLKRIYSSASGVNSEVEVGYKKSYVYEDNLRQSIKKALRDKFEKDKARGHTSVGPHRDIISFFINGRDASSFASQGESKNLVLALKATEISLYRSLKEEKPILLLDDITSELDRRRKNFLFNLLLSYSGQIFVTSTSQEEIPYTGERKVFRIENGKASLIEKV